MNENLSQGSNEARSSVLAAVSDWLKLLALIVLVAEVAFPIAMWQTPKDSTIREWYLFFMLFFLVVVVVGVFVDRYFSQKAGPREGQLHHTRSRPVEGSATISTALDGQVEQIRMRVQQAAGLSISVLTDEISHQLNELGIQARLWSRGEMISSVQRYNKVVLDLYEGAKRSIFSTTIRDYVTNWPEDLMERMIAASQKSRADVIKRVFVFGNRDEIDGQAIEVFKKFRDVKRTTALIYIDDEDDAFHFPSDISRDFVVIDDGEAIGVTLSYGAGNLQAQWYFRDEDRRKRFERTCKELESGSKTLESILEWWDSKKSGEPDEVSAAN